MPELNEKTIQDLSRLSRIEVSSEEIPALLRSLQQSLDAFDQLQELDLCDLPAYSHAEEQGVESLRKDEVTDTLDREALLANAPDQIGGMIRIPPVFIQPA